MTRFIALIRSWFRRDKPEIDFDRDVPPHDAQLATKMLGGNEARNTFYEDGQ